MAGVEEKDDGFLARWSERKLQARGDTDLRENPADAGNESTVVREAASEAEDVPVLTDDDMPPLESLDDGSDYSGFLSPGVSEGLRRKALSKLFHGAGFNIADGLDDYDEDFTSFLPLGDIITSDMRHQMEEAAKRLLAEEEAAAEPDDASDEQEAVGGIVATSQAVDADEGEDRTDGEPA